MTITGLNLPVAGKKCDMKRHLQILLCTSLCVLTAAPAIASGITIVNSNFANPALCQGQLSFSACVMATSKHDSSGGTSFAYDLSVFPTTPPPLYGWLNTGTGPTGEYIPSLAQYFTGSAVPGSSFIPANSQFQQAALQTPGPFGSGIYQAIGTVDPSTYYTVTVGVGAPFTLYNIQPSNNPKMYNAPGMYSVFFVAGTKKQTPATGTTGTGLGSIAFGQPFQGVTTSFLSAVSGPTVGAPLFLYLTSFPAPNSSKPFEVDFGNVMVTQTTIPPSAQNEFLPLPNSSTGFVMAFQGDVRGQLPNLAFLTNDPLANPFAKKGGANPVTATLDSFGNTVLTFSGSVPITSTDFFCYSPTACNGLPHFGFDTVASASLQIINQYWVSNPNTQFASLSPTGPQLTGLRVAYVTCFADVTSGGNTVGQWFEEPYTTDMHPALMVTNNTGAPETLSDVGCLQRAKQIPLDSLNFGAIPPPDQKGSPFIALAEFDGMVLNSGTSADFVLTPEPGTLSVVTVAAIMAFTRRKKSGNAS